jgi:ABC-type multidrug transport system ATPase subunit
VVSGRPPRIGYVPERFPSQQRMPALAYLVHMGRIRGLAAGVARARAADLLRGLALVGGTGTPLRQLSKGNAQKVAIAQALMSPPDLLVLDEPWSGLDASAHGVLRELIEEVAANGGAVVFTDHREAVVEAEASVVDVDVRLLLEDDDLKPDVGDTDEMSQITGSSCRLRRCIIGTVCPASGSAHS